MNHKEAFFNIKEYIKKQREEVDYKDEIMDCIVKANLDKIDLYMGCLYDEEVIEPPKYETSGQYKERTGEDYPKTAPVYIYVSEWVLRHYHERCFFNGCSIVIANEHGKPPADWRPE